ASTGNECYYPGPTLAPCTWPASIAPVGTAILGAGRWGHLDLVGEVTQRMLDSYTSSYGRSCSDCAALSPTSTVVIRGGWDGEDESYLVPTRRWERDRGSTSRNVSDGFRCARTP